MMDVFEREAEKFCMMTKGAGRLARKAFIAGAKIGAVVGSNYTLHGQPAKVK